MIKIIRLHTYENNILNKLIQNNQLDIIFKIFINRYNLNLLNAQLKYFELNRDKNFLFNEKYKLQYFKYLEVREIYRQQYISFLKIKNLKNL